MSKYMKKSPKPKFGGSKTVLHKKGGKGGGKRGRK